MQPNPSEPVNVVRDWLYQRRWQLPVTVDLVIYIMSISGLSVANAEAVFEKMLDRKDLWIMLANEIPDYLEKDRQWYVINRMKVDKSNPRKGMAQCPTCRRNLWSEETVDQYAANNPFIYLKWEDVVEEDGGNVFRSSLIVPCMGHENIMAFVWMHHDDDRWRHDITYAGAYESKITHTSMEESKAHVIRLIRGEDGKN